MLRLRLWLGLLARLERHALRPRRRFSLLAWLERHTLNLRRRYLTRLELRMLRHTCSLARYEGRRLISGNRRLRSRTRETAEIAASSIGAGLELATHASAHIRHPMTVCGIMLPYIASENRRTAAIDFFET